jgi:butyryl-CoA dehydrogenase
MEYSPPLGAITFALNSIADLTADLEAGLHGATGSDMQASVLAEAGRFASGVLAPLNRQGDLVGARFEAGQVKLPNGWREAYSGWFRAGWNSVDLPEEWGGMGLPTRLAAACMEIWTSACMSFALCPVLTQGASDVLIDYASDAVKARYLPKLVSGEWTATMNLTEPQAGSDLGNLRCKAVPRGDGTYRISGQKIFITYGEHDLTDNIVHLVLARLPDSPKGTKGISLFIVPKVLSDESDGSSCVRNDLACIRIEEKLGIHASPTCAMSFGENGGAIGWLVGEENKGLACMFTMMNKARLYTGLQGVAIAERAYQQALAFAKIRRQGRVSGRAEMSPIIEHPDVRRNLMTMKALIAAGRAIAYSAAAAIDRANCASGLAREEARLLAGLLTPITKAFCSEIGVEVTSLGLQVHGGMGFIEETGAAQHYRDSRITPIYEGTNGIQAIDLVTRKLARSNGAAFLLDTFDDISRQAAAAREPLFANLGLLVGETVGHLRAATSYICSKAGAEEQLAVATPYVRLFGITAGAAYLTKSAAAAQRSLASGVEDPVLRDAIAVSRFFVENIAPATAGLLRSVLHGADSMKAGCLSDFLA